jgi:hypothetical protein
VQNSCAGPARTVCLIQLDEGRREGSEETTKLATPLGGNQYICRLLDTFVRAVMGRVRTGGFFGIGGNVCCFDLNASNSSCLRSICVQFEFLIFNQPETVAYPGLALRYNAS